MSVKLAGNDGTRVPGYGAIELKASYQKNLGLAILISSVFSFGIMILISGPGTKTPQALPEPKVVVITDPIQMGKPPPILEAEKPPVSLDRSQILGEAKMGIPEPVPEDKVNPETTIPSQEQLALMDYDEAEDILTQTGDSIVFEPPPDPKGQRAEFIPHTEEPIAINKDIVSLRYPELALRAGIEGTVYVAALVDKKGNVRDAYIHVESGANAGFEEAALEQAYKLKYKPALNNNIPVEVWIIYKVDFKLK